MAKEIELSRGLKALVDDEDYDWLNKFKWYAQKDERGKLYAATSVAGQIDYMHRMIMEEKHGTDVKVDHKNHDTLDNRRENLRITSTAENAANNSKTKHPTSSKYKGVTKITNKRWKAHLGIDGKDVHLGYFPTEDDAARAYDKKALETFGDKAKLNFSGR